LKAGKVEEVHRPVAVEIADDQALAGDGEMKPKIDRGLVGDFVAARGSRKDQRIGLRVVPGVDRGADPVPGFLNGQPIPLIFMESGSTSPAGGAESLHDKELQNPLNSWGQNEASGTENAANKPVARR
jgi:hypothetical protein